MTAILASLPEEARLAVSSAILAPNDSFIFNCLAGLALAAAVGFMAMILLQPVVACVGAGIFLSSSVALGCYGLFLRKKHEETRLKHEETRLLVLEAQAEFIGN